MKLFTCSRWRPAWICTDDGEVFRAKMMTIGKRVVIKTHIGRMVIGNADGTTSLKKIASWWADDPTL